MKKIVFLFMLSLGIFTFWYYAKHPLVTTATIRNNTFYVDLAVTQREKESGLGNRDSLADNRGMLFLYDHDERYPFWMKNMRFPIDILWIKDKKIVDITKNVQPPSNTNEHLPVYRPAAAVNSVLELHAGVSQKYSLSVGDNIVINN